MTQVAPLTFGLFRKIFVPLDLERDVLRNRASPLALLEDSTYRGRARVSRLADRPAPRCPPWTGQRPQSYRIGLVAKPFQRNVFPLRQHHRVKQRAIACNGLRLSMLVGGEPLLGDRAGRFGTLAGIDILAALNVRIESVQAGLCIRLALEAVGALGSSGVNPLNAPARTLPYTADLSARIVPSGTLTHLCQRSSIPARSFRVITLRTYRSNPWPSSALRTGTTTSAPSDTCYALGNI